MLTQRVRRLNVAIHAFVSAVTGIAQLSGLAVGGGVNWQGESAAEAGNPVFLESYATIDFFAQYSWRKIKLRLNAGRLTDTWHLARGITRDFFYAGPERHIKLSARYSF